MSRKRVFFFIFLQVLFCVNFSDAQQFIPLNHEYFSNIEKGSCSVNSEAHTAFKPLVNPYISRFANTDSLILLNRVKKPRTLFHRKLRFENLFIVDTGDFHLTIDPILNFEYSREKGNSADLFNNTRGVWVQGSIGKKLAFESDFSENQTFFNTYINSFIARYRVVPGQGFPKQFKSAGVDYASANGVVSYTPGEYFNFQFGHGKNFIGDGYRSLFLSDNSFNYPYFKITTSVWKFQYTNMFASFLNLNADHAYEEGFRKKFGTFHYLSWNTCKRVQIGFFESIIWQNYRDSAGNSRGFDINYLNPVIFFRPVEFSLGSPDNALTGVSAKIKITDKFFFYGQFILDDLDIAGMKKGKGYILEKFGIQGGFKAYDLFKLKNLFFQSECNMVNPYVYAHKSPGQNYSHYNQALAHPYGANFFEFLSIIRYRLKDFQVEYRQNFALYGADDQLSHWGKDIFKSDLEAQLGYPSWGNKILQGTKTLLMFNDCKLSYTINPVTNLNISAGVTNRLEYTKSATLNSSFIYVGIRTSLTNLYYDF